MTDHIDQEVENFARQLDGLVAVDAATTDADTFHLAKAFRETPDGTSELLRFHATHAEHPGYARHVILAAISTYAMCIAVEVPTWSIPTHLKHLNRLALACRVLGINHPGKES
ncbi:hypothetical protein FBY40_1592 [Microbacterium sp. SLBN-154]|uniref:hypothetical protein n=1 Tax=Microbacterium sp. SLBN-154 TaxID=2768458 RepID=UPI00114EC3C0|nr:hypothetical protein [Microbacterium sp. SLBN-154]TQK19101.1 hypothetical protein FBY40_1592 [Microbacterium sp. SLBN-154]